MKKLTALLLLIVLSATLAMPALASGSREFEPTFLKLTEMSIDQYVSTYSNRCLFVTMVILDGILNGDEEIGEVAMQAISNDHILLERMADDTLACYLYGDEKMVMTVYVDVSFYSYVKMSYMDISSEDAPYIIERVKKNNPDGMYWDVPSSGVLTTLETVLEELGL